MSQTVAAKQPPRGDPGTALVADIKRLSGQNAASCIQCGTCSGSCQFSSHMKQTPRQVLELIRAGLRDEVLACDTFWYCASCYSCRVRCPRDINIPELMMALKRLRIYRTSERSAKFYRTFFWVSTLFGRMQETVLMLRYALATNPFILVGYAPFGLKLFLRGKMNLVPLPHRSSREVAAIVKKARELEGASP